LVIVEHVEIFARLTIPVVKLIQGQEAVIVTGNNLWPISTIVGSVEGNAILTRTVVTESVSQWALIQIAADVETNAVQAWSAVVVNV
jgi:hypothetical protein